jgi:hypothetical protein
MPCDKVDCLRKESEPASDAPTVSVGRGVEEPGLVRGGAIIKVIELSSKIKICQAKRVAARKFLRNIANGKNISEIHRSATRQRLLPASIKGSSHGFRNGL